MKYKPTTKQGRCNFKEWNKEKHLMCECSEPSKIKAGKGYICRDHALCVLGNDKKAELLDHDNIPIISVSMFLKICDGYKIEDDPELDF